MEVFIFGIKEGNGNRGKEEIRKLIKRTEGVGGKGKESRNGKTGTYEEQRIEKKKLRKGQRRKKIIKKTKGK